MPNYYDILEVGRDASESEIKKAYRAMSLQWHPDRNKSPEAQGRFQQIGEAYETLSDPGRRSQYDDELNGIQRNPFMSGHGGPGGTDDMQDIHNIFNMMFGGGMPGPMFPGMGGMPGMQNMGPGIHVFHGGPGFFQQLHKPPPIMKNVSIPFDQAYNGCVLHVPIEKWVMRDQVRVTETETIYVTIPAGADNGEMIILRDSGNAVNEQLKGDIKIILEIENNTPFLRHGMDLIYKKTITLKEALVGFSFDLVHVNGKTLCLNNHTNPTLIKPGFKKVIPGLGMKRDNNTGNLIIEFTIEFPDALNPEQIKAVQDHF